MTPQQQAEAYQKQVDIDSKQRAQELAYKQQQAQQIADIKINPRYGEYIQCVIDSDSGKYQGIYPMIGIMIFKYLVLMQ